MLTHVGAVDQTILLSHIIQVFSVAYRGFGDTLHFRQGVNTLYELGNNASQQFAPPEGVDVSTPAGNWNRGPIIGFKIADLSKKDTVNPYGKIMPGIWTLPGSDGGNATALPSPMPAELLPFSQYQETGQCPEGWERYQHDVQRRCVPPRAFSLSLSKLSIHLSLSHTHTLTHIHTHTDTILISESPSLLISAVRLFAFTLLIIQS